MGNVYQYIPAFPLLGFLINGLLGKRLSKNVSAWVGCLTIFISFALSTLLFADFNRDYSVSYLYTLFDWISTGAIQIKFTFLLDHLSSLMLLVITGVGFLIHWYSTSYMKDDDGFSKYFSFLNLFVFFMLVLVMGGNYLVVFIGWEGVGLCSYLLIGFWYKNVEYGTAARKAFIMNRIGDLGFLVGIFLILSNFGSLEFKEVFGQLSLKQQGFSPGLLNEIAIALFIGAVGKSAQIPLYTWLPDAMAGPTPVSALIHAATMVTAGIYMTIRSGALYMLTPDVMKGIEMIGLSTALLGAFIALTQNDIKKILAYSTVSQLGYMFLGLGAGSFNGSFFHVITHAFFKALLFLGAGSVIHAMGGEQDIRRMGGLKKKMPLTWIAMLIGTCAIAGLPPFSGFFSKDEILGQVFEKGDHAVWAVGVIGAFLTTFYMFRMLYVVFYGPLKEHNEHTGHLHESPAAMTIPLIILAFFSLTSGLIGLPALFTGRASWLSGFLAPVSHQTDVSGEGGIFPILVTVAGVLVSMGTAYYVFVVRKRVPIAEGGQRGFLSKISYNKLYVDELYYQMFVRPIEWLSDYLVGFIEKYIIDGIVTATGQLVVFFSDLLRRTQTGKIGNYLYAMLGGMLLLFFYLLFNR